LKNITKIGKKINCTWTDRAKTVALNTAEIGTIFTGRETQEFR